MSASVRLSPVDPGDLAELLGVADDARAADGADPFNEQARLDVAAGRRDAVLILTDTTSRHPDATVGAAILGSGEFDLVIDPARRGEGFGGATLKALLPGLMGEVTAWSHGDHPAARVLASRTGFQRVRTLLQLWRPLSGGEEESDDSAAAAAESGAGNGIRIQPFRSGADDTEWVALNATVFATHPEQGAVTIGDLHDRMAEDWFDADDFLVARDASGRMVGYNWLKLEEPVPAADAPTEREGEIYVIGVDAASAGRGLGRSLMHAGLQRLRERGCTIATLYVEGDNAPALRLYRSLGFADRMVDVQYRRA
ncbi:MAG TPA: mycothiol synthase [Humibacter sp.]|nr:mycothiol synthase [Humibacter sp.]